MQSVVRCAVLLVAVSFGVSSCGNTIRGVGRDTAGAINATQDAAKKVGTAVTR